MSRRLFRCLCALSLLLCIATILLRVRSFRRVDELSFAATRRYAVRSWHGLLMFGIYEKLQFTQIGQGPATESRVPIGDRGVRYKSLPAFGNEWDSSGRFFGRHSTIHEYRGSYFIIPATGKHADENGYLVRLQYLQFPDELVTLAAGVLPVFVALRHLRRQRRKRGGRCARCGYDLRASPGRCPECGALVDGDASSTLERPAR